MKDCVFVHLSEKSMELEGTLIRTSSSGIHGKIKLREEKSLA